VPAAAGSRDGSFGCAERSVRIQGIVREPTEFFGRQGEIADLIGRISRGQQVGLYGIHKIGKSSLLEQLRRSLHVSRPEFTIIQIELDGQGNGPGDFYRRGWRDCLASETCPPRRRSVLPRIGER